MSTHANMVKMGVTSVASAGTGTITLGAASSGYRHINAAITASATVDILITEGTSWEVARNCAYTYNATPTSCTIDRGTLESSSTGSAVAFTSAAVVSVVATADSGRRWDSAALTYVAATVTTGNVTGVVGTMHGLDIDGMTAARDFVLPTVAATGDRVGVFCTTDAPTTAAYVLQIKSGAAGDLINGTDHSSTIWSSLLIKGECLIFRCVNGSTVDWIVEYDGRIPAKVVVRNDGTTQQEIGITSFVKLQAALDAEEVDTAGLWDNSAGTMTARRAGNYLCSAWVQLAAVLDGVSVISALYKNGSVYAHLGRAYSSSTPANGNPGAGGAALINLAAGGYVEIYAYNSSAASAYNTIAGAERQGFTVVEVF